MTRSLRLLAFLISLALVPVARAGTTRGEITGVVNLNTATETELQMLPGIGPKKAQRIIEARQKKKFDTPEQIRRVKGFGRVTFRNLKPYLAVTGSTTIAAGGERPAVDDKEKDPTPEQAKPQKGKKKSAEKATRESKTLDDQQEPAPT